MTKATRPSIISSFLAALVTVVFCNPASAQDIVGPAQVQISGDYTVEDPLILTEPDPFRGLEAFVNRKLGNCVACHSNFDVAAMQFLGDIGPNLDWIGDRLTEGEIRAILIDPKAVFGDQTIMPAFYTAREGFRTLESFQGKTILTAQQIEDVVAYLASLSREASFDGVD